MESKEDEKKATEQAQARTIGDAAAASEEELDLEDLDLSVETVEERISPSETNVFDK